MRIHDLAPVPGSTKARKRVGRGHGSGQGKTAGYGHKGQKREMSHIRSPLRRRSLLLLIWPSRCLRDSAHCGYSLRRNTP